MEPVVFRSKPPAELFSAATQVSFSRLEHHCTRRGLFLPPKSMMCSSSVAITKVFTATGAQSAQKCALFSAASGGTMNHVLSFLQKSLTTGDFLTIVITITLG